MYIEVKDGARAFVPEERERCVHFFGEGHRKPTSALLRLTTKKCNGSLSSTPEDSVSEIQLIFHSKFEAPVFLRIICNHGVGGPYISL